MCGQFAIEKQRREGYNPAVLLGFKHLDSEKQLPQGYSWPE
jgi:hypothetical protein